MPTMSREQHGQLALLASPRQIEPSIHPGWGFGLWVFSLVVVTIGGQMVLPHALTNDPTSTRSVAATVFGAFFICAMIGLHGAYWTQLREHLTAERDLRTALTAAYGQRIEIAMLIPTTRAWANSQINATSILLGPPGATLILASTVCIALCTRALLSPEGSTDSPLLGLLFVGACLLPYGIAMLAVAISRTRLSRLKNQLTVIGVT